MQHTPSPAISGQLRLTGGRILPMRTRPIAGASTPIRPDPGFHPFKAIVNAALAAILVVIALGVWRAYDNLHSTGSVVPSTSAPGFAMQAATPSTTGIPIVTPPTPTYRCDFGRDVPIFQNVDESPVDGAALVLTTDGDLILTCPEEPAPIVLASGVNAGQVGPAGHIGLISYWTPGEGTSPGFITYVSMFSGASIKASPPPESAQTLSVSDGGSPWLITNSYDHPGIWGITDVRTMETRTLNDFAGQDILLDGTIVPPGSSIIADAAGDTLAIGVATNSDFDRDSSLFRVSGLPGALLVLDGSFDQAHWIDIPGDLGATRSVSLSPNGEFIALRSSTDVRSLESPANYAIVRIADGKELGRSGDIEFSDSVSEFRWAHDGRTLVYTDNSTLATLTAGDGAKPQTILQSDANLTRLGGSADSDIVLVTRMQSEEVATETPELIRPLIYSVNIRTGEAFEIEGIDVSHNSSPRSTDTRFLVMSDADSGSIDAGTASFKIVDAMTGNTIDELVDIEITQDPSGPAMGVASTPDGRVEVIAFNPIWIFVMEAGADGAQVRQLPSPHSGFTYPGSVALWLSNDGTRLSLSIDGNESGARYLLDLTDPEAAWVAVLPEPGVVAPGFGATPIFFVPGLGSGE